jgi:hypothetical protein
VAVSAASPPPAAANPVVRITHRPGKGDGDGRYDFRFPAEEPGATFYCKR